MKVINTARSTILFNLQLHFSFVVRSFLLKSAILLFFYHWTALMSLFSDVTPNVWCIMAAKKIHNAMLHRVLRCPMSFFESTPVGRIMSRFSKDIDILDVMLPMTCYWFVHCVFAVILSSFKCSCHHHHHHPVMCILLLITQIYW